MKIVLTESQVNLIFENTLPYKVYQNVDHNAYVAILKGIGAPVTSENLGFMYAWRECENSLGVAHNEYCNNPFNTTWDTDPKGVIFCSKNSTMYCRKNAHGVRSYKNINIGVLATIKTILNGKYQKLLSALRNSEKNRYTCLQIAQIASPDLDLWGTGGKNVINKCNKYLGGATPAPANIRQVTGCK